MPDKGGMTIPVFDCIFNGTESIESFHREFDPVLYETLPHLYAVCVADNSGPRKRIVAGFFVKTSYTHNDEGFLEALTMALSTSEKLSRFATSHTSLLPARLGVPGTAPLSETEMLHVMRTQLTKHATGGTA